MAAEPDAVTARTRDPLFVRTCSLGALQDRLPLLWPTPPGTPPSPKRSYRSHYRYLGWQDLTNPSLWPHLSDFDLLLRLIDFSGLRPVLAQHLGWLSARGWVPFDPVSLFLLTGWQITNGWTRSATLAHLRHPDHTTDARLFGFEASALPTEGALRYFLTTLGTHSDAAAETIPVDLEDGRSVDVAVQRLNQIIAQSMTLIHAAGFVSPEAWHKALVCPDGMIHDAASRQHCAFVRDSCYQPVDPHTHTRPCPATAATPPHRGCACNTVACATVCRHTTPRDPQARTVVYTGSNHDADNPNQPATRTAEHKKAGTVRYGYRSLPLQIADSQRRCSYVLFDDLHPASQREENPAAALLRQVSSAYPDLHLDSTAGDAGLGYYAYLHTAYAVGVKRVVDLRADASDQDKETCLRRGYDATGRPLCPHGYALTANGFDAAHKRHKWICAHACRQTATPPDECPFLTPDHPYGQIINVGECFADGTIRLVRDLVVETPAWERAYHRARNAVESRNATFERWGLKRLPVYGYPRTKALLFQADVWLNLTTMARLMREATDAARGP